MNHQGRILSCAVMGLLTGWLASARAERPITESERQHWAFVAPRRPELPPVRARGWVRNPIDGLILGTLEENGLQPSPEADRPTLFRRVCIDLTGLPPAPEQLDAFLDDPAPDAY